jgi:tRNA threonylcarbamoyladenosine biosynthesis protein TsaE
LEWIGIADYLQETATCFIEWPEKGQGFLSEPDVILSLTTSDNMRKLLVERMPEHIMDKFLIEKQTHTAII